MSNDDIDDDGDVDLKVEGSLIRGWTLLHRKHGFGFSSVDFAQSSLSYQFPRWWLWWWLWWLAWSIVHWGFKTLSYPQKIVNDKKRGCSKMPSSFGTFLYLTPEIIIFDVLLPYPYPTCQGHSLPKEFRGPICCQKVLGPNLPQENAWGRFARNLLPK